MDAGTFYLLPWVNPDGGMNEWLHNPEQRKTNYVTVDSANPVNIGWLGGGRADDPAPSIKFAGFTISELSSGDTF